MIAARGEMQQRLGHAVPAVGIARHQQRADLFGARRTTRLARGHHIEAAGAQAFGQALELRALAGPFPAFEGDEAAARHGGDQPPIRWLNLRRSLPMKPSGSTSLTATSETIWSGRPGTLMIALPTSWPFLIGAVTVSRWVTLVFMSLWAMRCRVRSTGFSVIIGTVSATPSVTGTSPSTSPAL